ncbi:MAG: hypothetical protein ACYTFA_16510, partial [Planctomycetota bacterium]
MTAGRLVSRKTILAVCICYAAGGCTERSGQCEPPVTSRRAAVSDASLSIMWSQSDMTSFRVVTATGPYRVSDFAVDNLRRAMEEQAGLRVEVYDGVDTGLPGSRAVDADAALDAGRAQIPPGDDPVLVIVTVANTLEDGEPSAGYGFIDFDTWSRPAAVMVLHREPSSGVVGGAISPEIVEASTIAHEVGHWLS